MTYPARFTHPPRNASRRGSAGSSARIRWTLILTCLSALPGDLRAQAFTDVWYPEVSYTSLRFGGDFDGSMSLAVGTRVFELPDLADATGVSFATGAGFGDMAVVYEYVRANPTALLSTGNEDASYRSDGLRVNVHPGLADRSIGVGPLFRVGGTYNTLTVPLSVTQGSFLDDARYKGLGFTAGVGVALRLGVLQLNAAVERRFVSYGSAKARDSFFELSTPLSGTIDVLSVGGVLYLAGGNR